MLDTKHYSVLMSVYAKEKPEYLRISLDSMLAQTVRPSEIVLVEDGPLTKDLEDTIEQYHSAEAGKRNTRPSHPRESGHTASAPWTSGCPL